MNTRLRRTSALAAAALVAGALALPAGTANAATGTPTDAAASWLTSQLTGGLIESGYNDTTDPAHPVWTTYVDQGQSADVAFSLAALGDSAGAKGIADALSSQVDGWYDYYGTIYTGSLAKAIVLGHTTGENMADWAGGMLVSTLDSHTATADPIAGRIENANEFDYITDEPIDSANVIGQAYAARALTTAGSSKAADAVAFLLKQQCGTGGFRLDMTADKTAADQTCDGAGDGAEVDATAYAVLQLEAIPATTAINAAITKARTWLTSVQLADGSWRERPTDTTAVPNSDSTGLAAQALGSGAAASKAATWIRARQLTSGTDTGAIAAQDTDLAAGLANGVAKEVAYNWRKATADAAPALTYLPQVVTPVPGTALPTPTVKAPHKAHAGSTVKLKIAGLKGGEKVTVKVRGKKVGHGKAKADGTFKVKVKLKGKLAKLGKAKVKVVGATSGKVATTTIKVVR
jgi:hypothetical protein